MAFIHIVKSVVFYLCVVSDAIGLGTDTNDTILAINFIDALKHHILTG